MSHLRVASIPSSVSTTGELEALLREGEESGEPIEMTASEWQRLEDDIEQDAVLRRKAS